MALKLSPALRVKNAFPKLTGAAEKINSVSDELAKPIRQIEVILKTLNLGVTSWHKMEGNVNNNNGYWWSRDIGYTKINGKWGVALRSASGDGCGDPDEAQCDIWLFNEAPRNMRVLGAKHLADLIESLIESADDMTESLQSSTSEASEVAAALREVAEAAGKK